MARKGEGSMIKVSCRSDIMKLFVKPLGSGEESTVGLLKDGKNVAKCFHQPRDLNEVNNLLMGKDLNQTSFCFLKDLYTNDNFIWGALADYAPGNKLSSDIKRVPFMNLLYSTLLLKRDIKTVSDAGIKVGDWKNFNMNFTDAEITITDVGRCFYSGEDKKEIYRYNLEMIFDVIKREYCNNELLKEIIEKDPVLNRSFKNNESFPEFFIELQKYFRNELGEGVSNLVECESKMKKI